MKTILLSLIFSLGAFATTVTSITCSGQTATVNATTHGLVASQGFSLSGTAPTFNSTTSSVTANAFTFVLPAVNSCSRFTTGYTSVVPATQIIELASQLNSLNATVTMNYLHWFTTSSPNPLSCTLPVTDATGVITNIGCPQSVWSGASAAENAAIVAGTTVESYGQLKVPAATSLSAVASQVVAQYNAMQVAFVNSLLSGRYYWNGVAWVNY
jgi:hypothetical protein